MPEGTAIFRVGLGDGVTRPARRMGSGVDRLTASLKRLERAQTAADRAAVSGQRRSRPRRPGDAPGARGTRERKVSYRETTSGFKAMGVAASVTAGVIGGLLAKKVYELTQLAGSSRLAFANMFGSERAGNAQLEKSIELANKFGLGLGETIGQVQKFSSLGFTPEQSEALIGMGGDMRALGRSSEEVRRIFLQLSQISAKGKLQGEELIVLAENGINLGAVYDRLGKKLGKTREEIIKMQGAGELKSAPALNSIAEVILATVGKSKLGEAGEEAAAKTIGGIVGKIGTKLETGLFRAVQRAEPGLVRGMASIMNGLAGTNGKGVEDAVTRFLEGLGTQLERIGPMLPGLADNFSRAFGQASGFKATNIETFADRLPQIATDLGTIAGQFASIVSWAAKLAKYAEFFSFTGGGLGGATTSGPSKAFQDDSGKIDPMLTYGEMAGKYKGGAYGDKNMSFRSGAELGENVATGLAFGINANMSIAVDAAKNMARSVDAASRQELDIHSPSGRFYDQGESSTEGLAFGMLDSSDVSIASARSVARGTIDASARALQSQSSGYGALTGAAADSFSGGTDSGARSISISIGDIVIQGQSDPSQAGKAVLRSLELELADLLERHMQGAGA